MKIILTALLLALSFVHLAQEKKKISTERGKNMILKASASIGGAGKLYIGQTYDLEVLASNTYDLLLTYENVEITLDETSLRRTGPLVYKVTPIDTGDCWISVGLKVDDKGSTSLFARNYRVIECPAPIVSLSGFSSGEVVPALDHLKLHCAYPYEKGLVDSYDVISWSAEFKDATYEGTGSSISKELAEAVQACKKQEFLYINVQLEENSTGHSQAEAVYIVRKE